MLYKLTLSTPMLYKPSDEAFPPLHTLPPGSETCLKCSYRWGDAKPEFTVEWTGVREPLTEEERRIVEAGGATPVRDGHTLEIPAGDYRLLQVPALGSLEEAELAAASALCGAASGTVYVRLFKENRIEAVTQFFAPA